MKPARWEGPRKGDLGGAKEHFWHVDRKHRKRTEIENMDFMKFGHLFEMLVYLKKK